MNKLSNTLKKLFESSKSIKIIIGAAVLGITLIYISTFFDGQERKQPENTDSTITSEEYCDVLEEKTRRIVSSITGDKNSVVVITLDTGVQYVYADETKETTENSEDTAKTEKSGSNEQKYITVKTSDGEEKPLIVTEYMPTVRGVAIVCAGGGDKVVCERVKNAVISALNITSKKIFVTGN